MKYFPPLNSTDPNAGYVNEDAEKHIAGSEPPAEAFEAVQREIVNAIKGAGLKPDKDNNSQLLEAIKSFSGDEKANIDLDNLSKDGQAIIDGKLDFEIVNNKDFHTLTGTKRYINIVDAGLDVNQPNGAHKTHKIVWIVDIADYLKAHGIKVITAYSGLRGEGGYPNTYRKRCYSEEGSIVWREWNSSSRCVPNYSRGINRSTGVVYSENEDGYLMFNSANAASSNILKIDNKISINLTTQGNYAHGVFAMIPIPKGVSYQLTGRANIFTWFPTI